MNKKRRAQSMAWLYMFAACIFEVIWAISMKYSDGFTRPRPTIITLVATVLSFVLLAQAVRTLPVGTGYTVLNGVGVAGTVVFGIFLFGESSSPFRLVCVALVLVGIIGLRFSTQ
jgi:quaternary ammonium compound-resistance protein SugE